MQGQYVKPQKRIQKSKVKGRNKLKTMVQQITLDAVPLFEKAWGENQNKCFYSSKKKKRI